MLKKASLVAFGLVLLASAAAVSIGRRSTAGSASPPVLPEEGPAPAAGDGLRELPAVPAEAPRSLAGPPASVEALADPEGPRGPVTGLVTGALLRSSGEFLPERWLAFVDPERDFVVARRTRARSDEHGFYSAEVPVGRWSVWYLGSGDSPSAISAGAIEVVAGATLRWDVVLEGVRAIRGELALAAEDLADLEAGHGQPFELEIRLAEDGALVARAEVVTERRPATTYDPALDDASVPAPPPRTRFVIDGLPARLLELRILLPGEFLHPRTGERFPMYVTRAVDLHEGDVTLPREELRYGDFIAATRERLLREGK